MIKHVAFAQPIWVLGTAKHEDQFKAPEWEIHETSRGVMLHRPEQQNVPEVALFEVIGIGYCVSVDAAARTAEAMFAAGMLAGDFPDLGDPELQERIASGSSDSKAAEAPAGNPADAGANPAPTTERPGLTKLRKGRRT